MVIWGCSSPIRRGFILFWKCISSSTFQCEDQPSLMHHYKTMFLNRKLAETEYWLNKKLAEMQRFQVRILDGQWFFGCLSILVCGWMVYKSFLTIVFFFFFFFHFFKFYFFNFLFCCCCCKQHCKNFIKPEHIFVIQKLLGNVSPILL